MTKKELVDMIRELVEDYVHCVNPNMNLAEEDDYCEFVDSLHEIIYKHVKEMKF